MFPIRQIKSGSSCFSKYFKSKLLNHLTGIVPSSSSRYYIFYGEILRILAYLVRMLENTVQKTPNTDTFTQCNKTVHDLLNYFKELIHQFNQLK